MGLDVLIGTAGAVVTVLVVIGMILITPRGATTRPVPAEDPGADTVREDAPARPPATTTRPGLPTTP